VNGRAASVDVVLGDLFRRESGHLVSALARLLGPSHLGLAEDMVQEALASALHSFSFGMPDNPKAWILTVAKNRALDHLRRERRNRDLPDDLGALGLLVEQALSDEADTENQLALMFALCDEALSTETHVTLILRLLCGFSSGEIARAFLVDVPTIDRRLHRGRARLRDLGELRVVRDAEATRVRRPSVERALYLLFNEGYHGSDEDLPLHPAMCEDAMRLCEMLLTASDPRDGSVHALLALFCFHAARLESRTSPDGVVLPLAEQNRSAWNRSLIERGIVHLGSSAIGASLTRWHLEAGIAFEHTSAASQAETRWEKVVAYYDALVAIADSPVISLNRALAIGEARGAEAGLQALQGLEGDPKLEHYSFYWAALAHLVLGRGETARALDHYARAASLSRSPAERRSYERRMTRVRDGTSR
jgi:RNA polymerase sigma-70 factor (ECF subfamily)